MNDIKLFPKKMKKACDLDTSCKKRQVVYRNATWHWKMRQTDSENSEKRDDVRYRTVKSVKHQNI